MAGRGYGGKGVVCPQQSSPRSNRHKAPEIASAIPFFPEEKASLQKL